MPESQGRVLSRRRFPRSHAIRRDKNSGHEDSEVDCGPRTEERRDDEEAGKERHEACRRLYGDERHGWESERPQAAAGTPPPRGAGGRPPPPDGGKPTASGPPERAPGRGA